MFLVDANWVFTGVWEMIKPLLRKYSSLVTFIDRAAARGMFAPGTAPPDFC